MAPISSEKAAPAGPNFSQGVQLFGAAVQLGATISRGRNIENAGSRALFADGHFLPARAAATIPTSRAGEDTIG